MKGHFVSEFHLKRFRAPAGHLWVYFHGQGWKKRRSADVASEQDFYSPELENAYHKIETGAANILDKQVFKRKPLTTEQRETLAYFLALMELRTPTFHENMSEPLSQLLYMTASNLHQFELQVPEKFEQLKREMADAGKPLPDWVKPEHLDPKKFKITPSKDLVFATGFEAAETSAGILNKMTWSFLTTSAGVPFITSDNPFCYTNWKDGQLMNDGLMAKNTLVTIPLSSEIALAAEWPTGHEYAYLPVNEAYVEQVNIRVMACSDKFIVTSTQSFPGVNHLAAMVRS